MKNAIDAIRDSALANTDEHGRLDWTQFKRDLNLPTSMSLLDSALGRQLIDCTGDPLDDEWTPDAHDEYQAWLQQQDDAHADEEEVVHRVSITDHRRLTDVWNFDTPREALAFYEESARRMKLLGERWTIRLHNPDRLDNEPDWASDLTGWNSTE